MGYYINIDDADFCVPTESLDAAMNALRELDKRGELKVRTYFADGHYAPSHFMWMPSDWAETTTSLRDFLALARFECSEDDDGLRIFGFNSKAGDERLFLNAIAPFVRDGSYIIWLGEDGAKWRDRFADGKMLSSEARIVWKDEHEAEVRVFDFGGAVVI